MRRRGRRDRLSIGLAACLFLWSVGLPMRLAKPLTVAQFAYYYGERSDIRRKLLASTAAAGVVVTLGCGAIAFFPRPRKLRRCALCAPGGDPARRDFWASTGSSWGGWGDAASCSPVSKARGARRAAPLGKRHGRRRHSESALNWPGFRSSASTSSGRTGPSTAGYRQACGGLSAWARFLRWRTGAARWHAGRDSSPRESWAQRDRRVNDLQRIGERPLP